MWPVTKSQVPGIEILGGRDTLEAPLEVMNFTGWVIFTGTLFWGRFVDFMIFMQILWVIFVAGFLKNKKCMTSCLKLDELCCILPEAVPDLK